MVISKRTYTKGHLTGLLLSVPSSLWHPLMTHTSTGDPPTLAGRYGSVSSGGTGPFCWVLVHTSFVCALEEWSLWFPQSCGSPVIKSCWPHGQVSWGFPVPFLDPQAGKPDVELRIFTTVGELRWYHCSPVCESSTHNLGMGFDFIMIAPLQWLPYHCSFFFFGCVVSFLGDFQRPSVNGCSTANCDFGALQVEMSTHPSILLYWIRSPQSFYFYFFKLFSLLAFLFA